MESIDINEIVTGINHLNPANIDIGIHHFSISQIMQMLQYENIIMDKTFRKKRNDEWTQERKSQLIESLIIRVPIGDLYFESTHDGKYIVVNGWQRLNSLNKFINTEQFCLCDLKYMKDFEQLYFKELPVPICRRIKETYIDTYVLRDWVPEDIKNDIAIRIR
ncbi:MAG: DUF262 domain-containing protein [Ruminococcus flavefaciens]|nr:DUF262 domain-containing protein [Ruminococcus flavefaciens]